MIEPMSENNEPGIEIDLETMRALWDETSTVISNYRRDVDQLPVSPVFNLEELRAGISEFDFDTPHPWKRTLEWVDYHMRKNQLHTAHPRYFGLFNPAPAPVAIAADALTAAYNPQLAAWSHSPFAVELERRLIGEFAGKLGMDRDSADGTFCSGGAEANHTALLCALCRTFPTFSKEGVRSLSGQPALYVSANAHHSWVKAARASGIGTDAVRSIDAGGGDDRYLRRLIDAIAQDRKSGRIPFLVCATAGTTNAGLIEPLDSIGSLAADQRAWYHVDAAWGGAACLVPEYRDWLRGIERADSIAFDAHKFLSIPMGAGMFFTKDSLALSEAFHISTNYMPIDAGNLLVTEPYTHSLQWSRRFIGLKVFMPLAVCGWEGFARTIRRQTELGSRLRTMLIEDGWQVVNNTPLPVICFFDPEARDARHVEKIAAAITGSGAAWISTTSLGVPVLRACITNFRTTQKDIETLVLRLRSARIRQPQKTKKARIL
jgi:aromatic-L-amino-acid decarboxylase